MFLRARSSSLERLKLGSRRPCSSVSHSSENSSEESTERWCSSRQVYQQNVKCFSTPSYVPVGSPESLRNSDLSEGNLGAVIYKPNILGMFVKLEGLTGAQQDVKPIMRFLREKKNPLPFAFSHTR